MAQGVVAVHSGRPIVRVTRGRVVVLCPVGHFMISYTFREWAGSMMEARCTDSDYTVACNGAVPHPPSSL